MPPSAFLLASIEPKSGTQAFSLLLPTDSLPEAQLSDQPTTGSISWGLDAHRTGFAFAGEVASHELFRTESCCRAKCSDVVSIYCDSALQQIHL